MSKYDYIKETGMSKAEQAWEDGFMSLDGDEPMLDDTHCFDCGYHLDECRCEDPCFECDDQGIYVCQGCPEI